MTTACRLEIPDRAALADLARSLACELRGGDTLILTGNLGAGKTTFTQFLGSELQVRGRIASPTFVIAREHRPRVSTRPGLVHVDAYRLNSIAEFDDLGIEAGAPDAVTVIEWGKAFASDLGPYLEIALHPGDHIAAGALDHSRDRSAEPAEPGGGDEYTASSADDEPRVLELFPADAVWRDRMERVCAHFHAHRAGLGGDHTVAERLGRSTSGRERP